MKKSEHPITPAQSSAINRFENAARIHEMKGSMHPNLHDEIEYDYESSKEALKFQFRKLNK